jgi:hypothetical protein
LCRDEFRVWHKCQKLHTCEQANALRRQQEKEAKKIFDKKRTWKDRRRSADFRQSAELKKGRHLCPECKAVYTFNRYRCDGCWSRLGSYQDIEALMTFGAGEAKRRSGSTVVHVSNKYI